jgi:hypothetical protein
MRVSPGAAAILKTPQVLDMVRAMLLLFKTAIFPSLILVPLFKNKPCCTFTVCAAAPKAIAKAVQHEIIFLETISLIKLVLFIDNEYRLTLFNNIAQKCILHLVASDAYPENLWP